MRRLLTIAAIALCTQLFAVASASAAGSKIATVMGDLRWGMSEHDVRQFAKRYLSRDYGQAIKKARGEGKKASLRKELDSQLASVDGRAIEFSGSRSKWDNSPVGGEFTYGNAESMITVEDSKAKNFFFFINGELWKWVKVFPPSEFGGTNFKKFTSVVNKRFGNGMVKSGDRLADREDEQQWVEFLDRQSRLRAVDQTEAHGGYALVFEHMGTVRDLSSLRMNAPERRPAKHAAKADDSSAKDAARPAVARKKRSSIFAAEEKDESDSEYDSRRKRADVAQQAKRRLHDRKQREKRNGAALEGVSAQADSDDPLAGL